MNRPVKPRQPRRRPRGSLTRQQVVDAALLLADSRGLEALTMPNLARQLDCGVMTIYGYIDNKEDLLDAIALRGLADLRLPRPLPSAPAAVLMAWGRALRLTLIEHPSLAVIFLSRAVIGPGIFQGVEVLLGALVRAACSSRPRYVRSTPCSSTPPGSWPGSCRERGSSRWRPTRRSGAMSLRCCRPERSPRRLGAGRAGHGSRRRPVRIRPRRTCQWAGQETEFAARWVVTPR